MSVKPSQKDIHQLDLAFQRATLDLEKNSFAPDPFKYCDYDYKLQDRLLYLGKSVNENEYRAQKAEVFDLPKGEYAIRSGLIMGLPDLTVINRLLADFIPALDKRLPAGVTAYRLRKDKKLQFRIERERAYFILSKKKREAIKIEESWYDAWPRFRKELISDLKSGKFDYVAKTDITSFFDDINLYILGDVLKHKAGKHIQSINLILEIYRSWALRDPGNVRQSRGLPQGSATSGILSNYYLHIVDSYLEKERKRGKIKWYRYCDDIYILCRGKVRAVSMLLAIGRLLRTLGLKQNAEKTKPLAAVDAVAQIHNEVAENVSAIIEDSKKATPRKRNLIDRLRVEYKKVSNKKNLIRKDEESLFRIYTCALRLNTPLLQKRIGSDFKKFPVRAKKICVYARHFINYAAVFKIMRAFIIQRKQREFLYNLQLAHLLTVFRNLKRFDLELFRAVCAVAFDNKRHWYVREQAVATMTYLGIDNIKKVMTVKLLQMQNHPFIRRAAITLMPLSFTPAELEEALNSYTRELQDDLSRMANFALSLIQDPQVALNHLRKFDNPNYVFLGSQLWRLQFIAHNKDVRVKKRLEGVLKGLGHQYFDYSIFSKHFERMRATISGGC